MIFWTFGCEPIFSEVWRTLDCTSIIEFEINNAPYIIHRYKNEIKIRHSNGKLHSFPKITGDYSKYFSELVNFNVLLPKKGQLTLETPPPAYYFIPFYIDQKEHGLNLGIVSRIFSNIVAGQNQSSPTTQDYL